MVSVSGMQKESLYVSMINQAEKLNFLRKLVVGFVRLPAVRG